MAKISWKARAIKAEARLGEVRKAIKRAGQLDCAARVRKAVQGGLDRRR